MARKIRVAFTEAEVAALLETLSVAYVNEEEIGGEDFEEKDIDSAEQVLIRALNAYRTAA